MAARQIKTGRWRIPLWAASFFLCFCIAAVTIVPIMLLNEGCFILSYDFLVQEVPFNIFMNRAVKEGGLWHWGIDLGGNLAESFAFYDLFSVFFLPTLLFPPELFPKLMGWMLILKFAVAGATASLWLRRHLKSCNAVLIGAVLYAFSGSQCINAVFYQFQDVAALFPLMLLGLELLLEEDRRGILAFACALNLLSNPVLFFSSVLFLVLYFLFVYAFPSRSFSETLRMGGRCVWEGLIGSLCGAIALIPEMLSMLSNPRASNFLPVSQWLYEDLYQLWVRFCAFLLPADNMARCAIGELTNWYSWNGYLPLFGIFFVILYLCKERDSLAKLILCLFFIALVPILNNAFFAFNANPYARWFFMFDLLLSCATAKVCEDSEKYRDKSQPVAFALLIGIFLLLAVQIGDIHRTGKLSLLVGLAIGSIFVCLVIMEKAKRRERFFAAGTVVFSAILFAVSMLDYSSDYISNAALKKEENIGNHSAMCVAAITELPTSLKSDVLPYRYHFSEIADESLWNYSMVNDLPSINSFTSSPHGSVTEFYASLGEDRTVRTPIDNTDGRNRLLGARYIISPAQYEGSVISGYSVEQYPAQELFTDSNGQLYYLQEDPDAIPIGGLLYTAYMTREDFAAVPDEEKAHVMMNVMVIRPEDEAHLNGSVSYLPYDEEADYGLAHCIMPESLRFTEGKDCFETVSVFADDGYAFYSVPYDTHWRCRINGAEKQPLNINGLMAVPVSAGENCVEFVYDYSPVWRISLSCTAVGTVLCVLLLMKNRKKEQ